MLKIKLYQSIYDINHELWDSLLNEEDIYHSHEFISLVEDSEDEGSKFWYLLIFDNANLVSTACLCKCSISLDVLSNRSSFWINTIRKYYNNFMIVDVLMCGLPISLGQNNVVIRNGFEKVPVLNLISDTMKEIAKENAINHLFVKEISEDKLFDFENLIGNGFFRAYSLPYMFINIKWKSFNEYLNSLRHPYRRKINRSLEKININSGEFNYNRGNPGVYVNDFNEDSANNFYRDYLAVMNRVDYKLEVLSLKFFKLLFDKYKDRMEYIQVKNTDETMASGILFKNGRKLLFMLSGHPQYKNDKYNPYFNLLYVIVNRAIELNCSKIELGQTAYWAKQQIGASSKNMYIFYYCRKKIVFLIIRRLKKYLFPPTILKDIKVFKTFQLHDNELKTNLFYQ